MMDHVTRISFISLISISLLISQILPANCDEADDNYILVNEEKSHFACRAKETNQYKLLPITKLCNGIPDCVHDADETADGCKRKEKVLVETLEDKKKVEYISEFREAVGRAVKNSEHLELEELLSQYNVDQYLTHHDHLAEGDLDKFNKVK